MTGWSALEEIAAKMVTEGKGILAADESNRTIAKRFQSIGLESTEGTRRYWREMLFRTEEALRAHISGVILFDETLRQKAEDGRPLVDILKDAGALAGIKVDKGVQPLGLHEREPITEGLDGLGERLEEYASLGASFAKWRAIIKIGEGLPSRAAIGANAEALARYAALCQDKNLVPIVEPEILMDGDHGIEQSFEATGATLHAVYEALALHGVRLEATLLKPNMVIAGADCAQKSSVEEVAEKTIACLKDAVPQSVGGIAFLSGGQGDEEATAHLDAMNKMGPHPWRLTFSYGRALQAAPLKAWGGKASQRGAAQKAFSHRARMNGLAVQGAWKKEMEKAA